ncbi:MAG: V-type ATP synthase subunit B [Wenzhouxiangellaceae bacterium]|nr:V-type ATP synthase subunit B [Wenzhouxiangellaceae bacterium]
MPNDLAGNIVSEVVLERGARSLDGPLLVLEREVGCGLHDAVEILDAEGRARLGRVVALKPDAIVVDIHESSRNLPLDGIRARFLGKPLTFGVGPGLLGRVLNGSGMPIDGGAPLAIDEERPVVGAPVNPVARELPVDFIETGITAIDLLNALVRGQKLPLFSGGGMPHDRLAIRIARHARLLGAGAGEFALVFAGIGVSHTTAELFRDAIAESGALERTVMFLNLADESSAERLLAPRYALTAAEYLAYTEGRHVLVVMTDMTSYCEALREVSAGHGEIPARKGYPGYMYSDLASLFERAGRIRGMDGSLTQLPILTMPGDDITHPIPDLTGYITEGQIVLDRALDRKGIDPPVAVLPSLSRLVDQGTGEGYTHADHPALASQLYAAYARTRHVRLLASVVGEEGLSDDDRAYIEFGDAFEKRLISQSDARTLDESMEIGWEVLKMLPKAGLTRLSDEQIERYLGGGDNAPDEDAGDG